MAAGVFQTDSQHALPGDVCLLSGDLKMKIFLVSIALLTGASLAADPAVADDGHSSQNFATVKLFFLNRWLPDSSKDPKAESLNRGGAIVGGGMGGGGMGLMISAQLQFETSRLYLNDNFIGNAMFRHIDVNPTLNLPPGDHVIRVECDGYQSFEQTLTVLQNGSVQWLVVKLERQKASKKDAVSNATKN
jgi:hypothetical protein